ncbi:L-dopachrome tautomerase yellow-f-like [Culicoides brevitarsis]|uniref:L-dopachrome tautomerase yellow-f-like n=1 Tax=Culicoides brevitarsis TaxID=469753 RepID=UPI00307B16E0
MFFCAILFVSLINVEIGQGQRNGQQMEEVFRWKQMGYEGLQGLNSPDSITFPSNENDTDTISDFNAYNNIPMGVEHFQGKLFVTVPRRFPGVASSLNYVDLPPNSVNKSPLLKPFPDVQTNKLDVNLQADSRKIVSVYRTRLDECNRLWFVDTGLLEYPVGNLTQVQPPSIWVMNPETGATLRRFEFPATMEQRGNGVASITVDVSSRNCDDAFAYVPDLFYNRMYVYSYRQNKAWTFVHNYFRMDPFQGDFNVVGLQYQWDDGIFSITLGPRQNDGFRDVYFHPMISINEFVVSSRVLQNEENADRVWHGDDFRLLGNRGPGTQSAMHQLDLSTGVMFFSEIGRNAIGCISSAKPLNSQSHAILVQDNERMVYPADLKVDSEGTLWVLSNTMPRYIYSQLNTAEFNFRIWRVSARELIKGTVCDTNGPPESGRIGNNYRHRNSKPPNRF